MKTLYEELGGTYRRAGDYLIPDIELPEKNYEIGMYGRMHHRYLKEHRKIQYTTMILCLKSGYNKESKPKEIADIGRKIKWKNES